MDNSRDPREAQPERGERAYPEEDETASLPAAKPSGTPTRPGASSTANDGEAKAVGSDADGATPSGRKEGASVPVATPAREGRINGHTARTAGASENWRQRQDRRTVIKDELHKIFDLKEDSKKCDRRRISCAPFPPLQRDEVEKITLKGTRCAEEEPTKCEAAATPLCYVKMLISNQLAGMVIGNTGQEVKRLKEVTGAKIVLSPHGTYFPGTTERLVSAEGTERSVFQVIDWIIDRMHELARSKAAGSEEKRNPLNGCGRTRGLATGTGTTEVPFSGPASTAAAGVTCSSSFASSLYTTPLTCKLCVPRAVVGSLIGRKGGYIQSVRVATEANINISPLFVTADAACAERIITIESPRLRSLRTATFTLARKINSHPEKATCKHMCYYRKLSFEPSPLALIEESRRERMNRRYAATDTRATRPESQCRPASSVYAENNSSVGSAEPRARTYKTPGLGQLYEATNVDKGLKELITKETDLLCRPPACSDDTPSERDVSCFSSASTATSATKYSSPLEPLLCRSSLAKIGGTEGAASSRLSSTEGEQTTSATESSLNPCDTANAPASLLAGFFNKPPPSASASATASAVYAAAPLSADNSCSVTGWRGQADFETERQTNTDKTPAEQHNQASDTNPKGESQVQGLKKPNAENSLAPLDGCHAKSEGAGGATDEDTSCSWSVNNAEVSCSPTSIVHMHADSGCCASSLNVSPQLFGTDINAGGSSGISFHPCTYPKGLVVSAEAQYVACALSQENMNSLCSTAAGSVATLTNILQGIHEDVSDQQPGSSRGASPSAKSCDPQTANSELQDYSVTGLQRTKRRQAEQRGSNAPEDPGTLKLQLFPGLELKTRRSSTDLGAAGGRFGGVTQSNTGAAETSSATMPNTKPEKPQGGLDPAAAEFYPSAFMLHYAFQQPSAALDLRNAVAAPSAEEDGSRPGEGSGKAPHLDGLRGPVGLRTAGGEDTTMTQRTDDDDLSTRKSPRLLSEETDAQIQHTSRGPTVPGSISSAVSSDTRDDGKSSELAPCVHFSSRAQTAEESPQTPLSAGENEGISTKSPQNDYGGPKKKRTLEEEATEKEGLRDALNVSACSTLSQGLNVLALFSSWIPTLLDCSFPAFMTLWTTALAAGLLLSFFFTLLATL